VANPDKRAVLLPARRLADLGFELLATRGTAAVLTHAGIPVREVPNRSEGSPSVCDLILEGEVDLVINTPFGREPRTDGYYIRTAAVRSGIPCITTIPGILAAVQGVEAVRGGSGRPRSLQEYHRAQVGDLRDQEPLPFEPTASPPLAASGRAPFAAFIEETA
jgi:carbamoyl-phosphate synthase large subunit